MTSDRKNDLRKYEMDDNDWKLAEQLRNVLEVSLSRCRMSNAYLTFTSSSLCPSQHQIVINSQSIVCNTSKLERTSKLEHAMMSDMTDIEGGNTILLSCQA